MAPETKSKRARPNIRGEPTTRRKKRRRLDYAALWRRAIAVQMFRARERIECTRRERKRQFEVKRQALLKNAVQSWHNAAQKKLLTAFKRCTPAMQWFSSTLVKIRNSRLLERETAARRLVTCQCGGRLTSSWDTTQKECRPCNLGLIGNICYCTRYQEETLACTHCNTPRRQEPAPARKELSWLDIPVFQRYFPRLFKSYMYSEYYYY